MSQLRALYHGYLVPPFILEAALDNGSEVGVGCVSVKLYLQKQAHSLLGRTVLTPA